MYHFHNEPVWIYKHLISSPPPLIEKHVVYELVLVISRSPYQGMDWLRNYLHLLVYLALDLLQITATITKYGRHKNSNSFKPFSKYCKKWVVNHFSKLNSFRDMTFQKWSITDECFIHIYEWLRVESLNPGRVNKINRVSKFSSIWKSFTLVCHYTGR